MRGIVSGNDGTGSGGYEKRGSGGNERKFLEGI